MFIGCPELPEANKVDWTGALLAKDASPDVVASSPWQIFGCKNGVCRTRLPEAKTVRDSVCGLSNKQSRVRVLHEYEMIYIYRGITMFMDVGVPE